MADLTRNSEIQDTNTEVGKTHPELNLVALSQPGNKSVQSTLENKANESANPAQDKAHDHLPSCTIDNAHGQNDQTQKPGKAQSEEDPRSVYVKVTNPDVKSVKIDKEATKQAIDLVNQDRVKHGLSPLKENAMLDNLAQIYAYYLAKTDHLAHKDSFGRSSGERADLWGIKWSEMAENLAQVNVDEGGDSKAPIKQAEQLFMNEPENEPNHRHNILSPGKTEIGVGVAVGDNGKVYVVQEFTAK